MLSLGKGGDKLNHSGHVLYKKKVKKFKKIKLTFILDSLRQNLVIKQISSRGFLLWHHQEAHQISQKCPLLRREQRAEKKGILRYLL
jgi:hypothetical protein